MFLGDYYDAVMEKVAERGNKGSLIGAGVGSTLGVLGTGLLARKLSPRLISLAAKKPRLAAGLMTGGVYGGTAGGAVGGAALGHRLLDRKKAE